MSKQITLIQVTVAALLLAVGAAHAAPAVPAEGILKLPRVVVIGKAPAAAAVQVTQIETLPRVVVIGPSLKTRLQQQQTLAAASAGKSIARAL